MAGTYSGTHGRRESPQKENEARATQQRLVQRTGLNSEGKSGAHRTCHLPTCTCPPLAVYRVEPSLQSLRCLPYSYPILPYPTLPYREAAGPPFPLPTAAAATLTCRAHSFPPSFFPFLLPPTLHSIERVVVWIFCSPIASVTGHIKATAIWWCVKALCASSSPSLPPRWNRHSPSGVVTDDGHLLDTPRLALFCLIFLLFLKQSRPARFYITFRRPCSDLDTSGSTGHITSRSHRAPQNRAPAAPSCAGIRLEPVSGMVVKEDGTKWACQSCLKGHRVSGCTHTGTFQQFTHVATCACARTQTDLVHSLYRPRTYPRPQEGSSRHPMPSLPTRTQKTIRPCEMRLWRGRETPPSQGEMHPPQRGRGTSQTRSPRRTRR